MAQSGISCIAILSIIATSAYAENAQVHEKVQAALDYRIPLNSCVKPKAIINMASVIDSEGQGGVTQSDVDSYTINRLKRKERRWQSCVKKYKKQLLKDLAELKNCAQYGLTQAQAKSILVKMAGIQTVVMTVDGVKPVEAEGAAGR